MLRRGARRTAPHPTRSARPRPPAAPPRSPSQSAPGTLGNDRLRPRTIDLDHRCSARGSHAADCFTPGFAKRTVDTLRLLGAEANGLASDEYQLGAQVVGAVVCAWLEQWNEADRVDDERRKDEAASALATAAEWQLLRDMNDEGDYPEVVWEHASLVTGEPLDVPEGSNMREGPYVAPYDEEFHVADYWQSLGCRPPR